jgi:DeoR/GlpR family transcriptional regulator of sugar metabolism
VTHSVPVIQHLLHMPEVRLVGLGGELYAPSQAFIGPASVEQTRDLRVRAFFLGAAAVNERGVYVESDIERPIKLALMDAADQVVLVVDSGKFHRAGLVRLCGLDRVSTLVTDAPPPASVRHEQRRTGLEILVAETPGE